MIDTSVLLHPRSVTTTPAQRLIRNQKQLAHVKQLWYFLASVLFLLTLVRVTRYVWAKLAPPPEPRDVTRKRRRRKKHPFPSHLFCIPEGLSAFSTGFRIVFFRWSVPIGPGAIASMSELTFILLYIAAMFVWLLVDTQDLASFMYQDRAALMGSSQLPIIVALAGKNNVISWMTGIGHEKLNVLHRAAARTNFIFLWIHGLTRVVSGLSVQSDLSHDFMRAGVLGLAAFSVATILSVRPIRHVAFEFFLVTHIVLILIFLVAGYYHAKEFNSGDYIWPALLVWAFDRALRLGRLFWNNKMWSRSDSGDALVELLSEDTIRLTLTRRISWTPGQHAYVILPTISNLPFEAHPFTISSIPEDGKQCDVVFLIRGRSGFTRKLREHATKDHGSRVPAFLDGPYGCPPDLTAYTTCVLVAGGSGISVNARGGKSAVRRIVFVWAVRDAVHVKWISKTLIQALSATTASLTVEPRIYITGKNYPIPETTPSTELPVYSSLKLIHGRPSIKKLLNDEIASSLGPISVDVSGPSSLADSIRRALISDSATPAAVLKGSQPVTLHVETFGMVKK
ncbi:FAD-binding domain-containing protein [Flammula alnicola]|nr:FAD-binding domain-containing protein [Flammula alnicola]